MRAQTRGGQLESADTDVAVSDGVIVNDKVEELEATERGGDFLDYKHVLTTRGSRGGSCIMYRDCDGIVEYDQKEMFECRERGRAQSAFN